MLNMDSMAIALANDDDDDVVVVLCCIASHLLMFSLGHGHLKHILGGM